MNIGIDLGSRSIKIYSELKGKSSERLYDTMEFYRDFMSLENGRIFLNLDKLEIAAEDKIVATGYGKHNIVNTVRISEQKAHMLGAIQATGLKNFILLDIGGQDTKVIKVVDSKMVDVLMNDKCGASSGRYFENMAKVLGMSLKEISGFKKDPIIISNTCAVFGESEVLGKVFEGIPISRIAAGINYSIFKKFSAFVSDSHFSDIVFSGGLAQNQALVDILKEETHKKLHLLAHPQFNGAKGAYLFSLSL